MGQEQVRVVVGLVPRSDVRVFASRWSRRARCEARGDNGDYKREEIKARNVKMRDGEIEIELACSLARLMPERWTVALM